MVPLQLQLCIIMQELLGFRGVDWMSIHTAYYVVPIYCDDCEENKITRAYERDGSIWFCCEPCFL